MLTTPVYGHRAWECYDGINVWKLENTCSLLFLDHRKEHTIKGQYYFSHCIDLFGPLTREFYLFLEQMDDKDAMSSSSTFENRYMEYKENELYLCSMFVEYLNNQHGNN